MINGKILEIGAELGACEAAVEWAAQYPSVSAAWAACERGDWMLWYAAKLSRHGSPQHRRVVLATCAVARTVLRFVPKGERRPLKAIQTAERWARRIKGVSLNDVNRAADAAADAAAYAAYAAADAAAAAADAAAAAYAAADAADAAYAAAVARVDTLSRHAAIVRRFFQRPPRREAR